MYTTNPALQTCWQCQTPSGKTNFRVTGIWGTGFLNNYQVVSYELTPLAGGEIKTVPSEKMREMIREGILTLI